jgi:hypothetical protein
MTQLMKTSHTPAAPLSVGLVALLLLAGCGGGSGQGLDENGNLISSTPPPAAAPPPGAPPSSGNPNATLNWVQTNVFGGVCSQCHTGAGAPFGVNWSSEANTCANIGRTSGEMPALKEIVRGDPAASYVIWKVEGAGPGNAAIVGGRMPLNNPALSAGTIKKMRDWIADGAPGC